MWVNKETGKVETKGELETEQVANITKWHSEMVEAQERIDAAEASLKLSGRNTERVDESIKNIANKLGISVDEVSAKLHSEKHAAEYLGTYLQRGKDAVRDAGLKMPEASGTRADVFASIANTGDSIGGTKIYLGNTRRDRHGNRAQSIQNALTISDGTGGELVEEVFSDAVIRTLYTIGSVRRNADVRTVNTLSQANWPSMGIAEGTINGINVAQGEVTPTTGTVPLRFDRIGSGKVYIPMELQFGSPYDVVAVVAEVAAEAMARAEDTATTVGTAGVKGFTSRGNRTVTAPNGEELVTNLSYDILVDAVHNLDPAYAQGAVWLMNNATLGGLRKLKDENGLPLWLAARDGVTGQQFLGHPVDVNQKLPNMAAGAYAVYFGDFRIGYKLLDFSGAEIYRFTDTPDEVAAARALVIGQKWTAGNVVDQNAIVRIRNAAS